MGKKDLDLRKRLATNYARRVNKWAKEADIEEHPDTYREYQHSFRDEEQGRCLGNVRVSATRYERERSRIQNNVDSFRSRIRNTNDGIDTYSDKREIFRHRFPAKELTRPRLQTRFTDTTRKFQRKGIDHAHFSCLSEKIPLSPSKKQLHDPTNKRPYTQSWKNLRAQNQWVWREIPRPKNLDVPSWNKSTSPEIPGQFRVKVLTTRCGTFSRTGRKTPVRPATSPNLAPLSIRGNRFKNRDMSLSSSSSGQKRYWKATRELAQTSPTNMGTKPRLNWTRVSEADPHYANNMLKSRYEYSEGYFMNRTTLIN